MDNEKTSIAYRNRAGLNWIIDLRGIDIFSRLKTLGYY